MLGAVLSEMNEDWSSRRWLTEESITQAANPAAAKVPMATYNGTPKEHARRIIDVVVADNPVNRKMA